MGEKNKEKDKKTPVFVKELGLKEFQDIESVAQDVIDNFVKKETKFENWQEMQQRAVSDYMTRLF